MSDEAMDALRQQINGITSDLIRVQGWQDGHDDLCAERYKNINDKLTAMQIMLTQYQTQNHERFNGLSSRIWNFTVAGLGGAIIGIGALAFYLITQGAMK